MKPPPPELFSQRPVRSDFGRAPSYRTRRIITVCVVVVFLAAGARLIFGNPFAHSGEVATIKADGAWKQKPESPGGIDIPNQDVQVYQSLDTKDDAKPGVEHLMAPPETPQPVPGASAAANTPVPIPPAPAASSEPPVESLTPPKLDIDTIAPAASAPEATASEPAAPAPPPAVASAPAPANPVPVAVASVAAPKPAPSPKHVKAAKPAPAMTIDQVIKDAQDAPKSSRAVQLASMPDQAAAQAMAEKLQSRYATILGAAQLRVVEADVEGKGTYYRIESPPLSADHAGDICSAIKKMKAGCILVRP